LIDDEEEADQHRDGERADHHQRHEGPDQDLAGAADHAEHQTSTTSFLRILVNLSADTPRSSCSH